MKTYIFTGFSASKITVEANSFEEAKQLALQIDYENAFGNIPDVEYVGQKVWKVEGSQNGVRQFDNFNEAEEYYEHISITDNCGLSTVIIKD